IPRRDEQGAGKAAAGFPTVPGPVAAEGGFVAGEQIEELVPLFEVQPLPPLPVEEGLEMLPPAEEAGRARIEAGEAALIMGGDEIRGSRLDDMEEPEEL